MPGRCTRYIYGEEKTRYLSELQAGDDVMIVRSDGDTRHGVIGRVKIERAAHSD